MSILNTKVLVLNRSFLPVHVTAVRRAVVLLYQDVAQAVDGAYRTFTFDDWRALSGGVDAIGVVGGTMRVPRVIRLVGYDRMPRRHVRFSRINVYARDKYQCQYCGRQLPRTELNLDHVMPRSRGGGSVWENVVCSCHRCNRVKGGRTPTEAGMRLMRPPFRPSWVPFMADVFGARRYREWHPFLGGREAEGTRTTRELDA